MNHDVIAIGASAGGVQVLLDMVQELPRDLPASVFVVLRTAPLTAHESGRSARPREASTG